MVSGVFFYEVLFVVLFDVLFLCCTRSDSWLKSLGCRTIGLWGWNKLSYVGFSIENKMADLNTIPSLAGEPESVRT